MILFSNEKSVQIQKQITKSNIKHLIEKNTNFQEVYNPFSFFQKKLI